MSARPDELPLEVLAKIFSYLSYEDLVKSVQFVCTWWRLASRQKSLWTSITYTATASSEEVIRILKLSPELRILELYRLDINNSVIQYITDHCPNLEHLVIFWDCIYNCSNTSITRPITQIKKLFLKDLGYQNMDFTFLQRIFPNLEYLDISPQILERKDLELYLYKQHSLHSLRISCKALNGHCNLPCLSNCKIMKKLILGNVCKNMKLSPKELNHLGNISTLKLLNCSVSESIGSESFFSVFPNIETLELEGCFQSNEDIFIVIAKNCPRLKKLIVFDGHSFCGDKIVVQDSTLKYALHLRKLTHLSIDGNRFLTDKGIHHLQLLPELTHLDLYKCVSLTTASLKLIYGFNKLQVLKIDLDGRNPPACDVKNKTLGIQFYKS